MTLATDTPGGTDNPPADWASTLSPEMQTHPSLEKYKGMDQAGMFKSLVDMEGLVGADKVAVPAADAAPEVWAEFRKKTGTPDTVEGYKFEALPENLKGLGNVDKLEGGFKEVALKAGLDPKQATIIRQWFLEHTGQSMQEMETAKAGATGEAEKALKTEWGTKYDANLAAAQRVVRKFGDPETLAALESGLGNDSRLVKFLARIGGAISEDTLKGGTRAGDFVTADAAKKEIASIQSDPKNPYFVKSSPEHAAAVAKMTQLYEIAYPTVSE